MKLRSCSSCVLGVIFITWALAPACVNASVLTFESCGGTSGAILDSCYGGMVNPIYGNRIVGPQSDAGGIGDRFYSNNGEGFTPNVLTTIDGAFGWGVGFGLLENAIFADAYTGLIKITFRPDHGYRAKIISFSMGAMMPPPEGYNDFTASIFDENENLLWSQSYQEFGAIDIHQIINYEGSSGSLISLVFDLRNLSFDPQVGIFDRELIGFDNVVFSQTLVESPSELIPSAEAPETSTICLFGVGILAIAIALRHRRAIDAHR